MTAPTLITAGDARMWTLAASDIIVSSAWGCKISFRGPTTGFDLNGTVNTCNGWDFVLSSDQSATMNAGLQSAAWSWQAIATKNNDATQRMTICKGVMLVNIDISNLPVGSTYDGSTDAETVLLAIEAEIKARVSGGLTAEYTIGSRSLKREPMKTLLDLKSRYQIIVFRERNKFASKQGLGGGSLGVRFT